MINSINDHQIYFIDIEISGKRTREKPPSITQIGIVDSLSDNSYSSYIGKQKKQQYPDFKQVFQEIKRFLNRSDKIPIIVSYNGKTFDFPILRDHLRMNDLYFEEGTKFCDFYLHLKRQNNQYFKEINGRKTLGNIYQQLYQEELKDWHDALADSIALKKIFYKAQEKYGVLKNNNKILDIFMFSQEQLNFKMQIIRKESNILDQYKIKNILLQKTDLNYLKQQLY